MKQRMTTPHHSGVTPRAPAAAARAQLVAEREWGRDTDPESLNGCTICDMGWLTSRFESVSLQLAAQSLSVSLFLSLFLCSCGVRPQLYTSPFLSTLAEVFLDPADPHSGWWLRAPNSGWVAIVTK